MSTGEILALLSLVCAVLGFAGGRISATKEEGKDDGIVAQKLEGLTEVIAGLQKQVDKISDRMDNQIAGLQKDMNDMRERVATLEAMIIQGKH